MSQVVWFRIRGRDRDRQLRKKLRVSSTQLNSMGLIKFQEFLRTQLELSAPPRITYCDNEGDKVPVTTDDEFNVLVYLAEMAARGGGALELRLREPAVEAAPARGRGARPPVELVSARRLASQEREAAAADEAELWRRVEAWRRGAAAGQRPLEPPPLRPELARTKGNAGDAAGSGSEPPSWFGACMKQFRQELLMEVVAAVKSELKVMPVPEVVCPCACGTAATPTPSPVPSAGIPAPPSLPASPEPPPPPPPVPQQDRAVQTSPPASAAASIADLWPSPATASPPIDTFGLFSVSSSSASSSTTAGAAAADAGDHGRGRSVSDVHVGKTVYSDGGRTVVTTGGRPPLRTVASAPPPPLPPPPAGRPRPRPRRCHTDTEDADYRCMLVMTEHAAADAAPEPATAVADGAPPPPAPAGQKPERPAAPEPEDDYVTVNGRRLSLSEDELSDIVIIPSPDGSERFEMVEEEPEELQEPKREPAAQDGAEARPAASAVEDDPLRASTLSEKWSDAAVSLDELLDLDGTSWVAASAPPDDGPFSSGPLRSQCESAPAACPLILTTEAEPAPRVTNSLPAAAVPAAAVAEAGRCSMMDPLSALPEPARRRLVDSLERLPERRQMALVAELTGRRWPESFWDRLAEDAEATGFTRMELLLRDQSERPCGIGHLADSLHAVLHNIKVTASSSAEQDDFGAQAGKHALCVLRSVLRASGPPGESAPLAEEPEPQPESESQSEPQPQPQPESKLQPQPELEPEPSSRDQLEALPARAARETVAPAEAEPEQEPEQVQQQEPELEPEQEQQQEVQQQPEQEPKRAADGAPGGWTEWTSSGVASVLPEWVLNLLQFQRERGSRESVPTEREAKTICQLVDMGFSDLGRIRALYLEYGDDCNEIATRLLDGAE